MATVLPAPTSPVITPKARSATHLGITEVRNATAAVIRVVGGPGEHSLELLRHPDRRHPRAPLTLQPLQIRRITSPLRSPLAKRTTGMSCSTAKSATALRNPTPIRSKTAGDGIGNPRCRVKKLTTCPGTCKFGTQPFK
jgi:hypothetical protein